MSIFQKKKLTKVGYLTIAEVTFKIGNCLKNWTYVKNGKFVAALVYNKANDTFLFVRQLRIPTSEFLDDPEIIEIVCGMHDQETLELTLKKEVIEELGILESEIVEITKVLEAFSSPGTVSEFGYYYYVVIDRVAPLEQYGGLEEEGECIERITFTPKEALTLLDRNWFVDLKTQLLLNWWFRKYRAN